MCFLLAGGAVGGFLIALVSIFYQFVDYIQNRRLFYDFIETVVASLFFMPLIGAVVGSIPALLTGIYLAYTRFYIAEKAHYAYLFLMGIVVSFLVFVIAFTVIFHGKSVASEDIMGCLLFSLAGGLSAMICGKLFLPKIPKDT
ncbi:MAG: hypothetical protein Q4B81_04335 [Moraxella sp.]|nr:hypothetical protein [Moraxella sp.]